MKTAEQREKRVNFQNADEQRKSIIIPSEMKQKMVNDGVTMEVKKKQFACLDFK